MLKTFNNKAKLGLFCIIIIVILALIFSFLPRKNSQDIDITTLPGPKITSDTDKKFSLVSQLTPERITIPSSLPVFYIDNTIFDASKAKAIARSLGFQTEPSTSNDVANGTVYIWYGEQEGSLWISPNLQIIDFKKNIQESSKQEQFPDENQLQKAASDFLKTKQLIENTDFKFAQIEYVNLSSESSSPTTRSNAEIASVYFEQSLQNFPIVTPTHQNGSINVKLNRAGQIVQVYISVPTKFTPSQDQVKIKTYSELIASLGEAKLQNIDLTLIPQIGTVTITEAQIGYLKEEQTSQQFLQPIFILTGQANINGANTPLTFYLSAISTQP